MPKRGSKRSTRRAAWLMRSVVFALLVTNVMLILHDRHNVLQQTRVGNTNLARAVSERTEASIAEIDHVVGTLVDQIEGMGIDAAARPAMDAVLAGHVARIDQLDGLYIYRASGELLATSEAIRNGPGDAAQARIQRHRDDAGTSALLGPPSINPLVPSRWTLPLSRRIDGTDGRFEGIVVASISIDHFRRVLERFDIGGGAITLTVDGRHLVRRPFRPADIGKPVPAAPGVTQDQESGSGDARSPVDGLDRVFSFENNRNYPLRVVVAADKAEVLRDWWIASILQSLWVALLCWVLKRSGDHARRALRNRQEAERSLRKAHASLADANERLQRLAQFDELTSLPNRRYFDRRFARAFRSAQRERQWLAVVMVDIDLFKTFNDRYGHPEGDRCLATVAAALRAAVGRPDDFIARYGGEEMVLLLPGSDPAGAMGVAQTARQAVLDANIAHTDNPQGRVTVSLGVAAIVPEAGHSADALLKAADDALYAAKHAGRNRVQLHRAP